MKLTESAVREMVARIIVEMSSVDNPAIDKSLVVKYAKGIYAAMCMHIKNVRELDIPPVDPDEGFDPPEELHGLNSRRLVESLVKSFARNLGLSATEIDASVEDVMIEVFSSFEYMIVMSEAYNVPDSADVSFAYDAVFETTHILVSRLLGLGFGITDDLSQDELDKRYRTLAELTIAVKDSLGTRMSTYPAGFDQG